jgi:CheY-like chemotaxis protein
VLCRNILIVEDDVDIRLSLQELLQAEGYNVHGATNGKEGLEWLHQMDLPCLILLDLMMPVMDGWEFAKIKQQDGRIAPIPVVVVSAFENAPETVRAARYIKKPIKFDALLQVVHQYCG